MRAVHVLTRHVVLDHRNFGEFEVPGLRHSAPWMPDVVQRLPARIETARLVLRRFVEADLDDYCERILGDADVMRTLPGGVPLDLEAARPRARAHLDRHWAEHGFGPWIVERRDDRRLIGHCGLRHWPDSEDVEVLYAFEPPAWGQGFATEAARASVRAGFESLDLARIIGAVLPGNRASEAVLRGLGMIPDGRFEFAGLRLDRFALAAPAWRGSGGGER